MATMSFSRGSFATRIDGTVVGLTEPRYETGKFGQAIMIEEGTENKFLSPADLSTASWSDWGQIPSTVAVVGPKGNTINATRLTETAINDYHYIYQYVTKPTATALTYTATIYAKAAERTMITVKLNGTSSVAYYNFNVNLLTGAVAGISILGMTACSNTVVDAENGWWKITITGTTDLTVSLAFCVFLQNTTLVYLGDITKGVYLYTAQLEQKAYATSFIAGTRNAETVQVPASVLDPAEGTIEFWYSPMGSHGQYARLLEWGNFSADLSVPKIALYNSSGMAGLNYFVFEYVCGGGIWRSVSVNIGANTVVGNWYHVVATWKVGEKLRITINGTYTYESTTVVPSAGNITQTVIDIGGSGNTASAENSNCLIDDLQFHRRALTPAEILASYQRRL